MEYGHRDNNSTVEFDAFSFSVKEFLTRHILLRCGSLGDLYPVTQHSPIPHDLLSFSPYTWHQRLRHPEEEVLHSFVSLLTTSPTYLLQRIISSPHKEFDMTDMGALNYFLGISVTRDSTCIFLSQKKYAMELLDRAHTASCNPTYTSVDTESKLGADEDPGSDPILYRSLTGGLQYLTFTRLDTSYVLQQVYLYIHDPREPHFLALKRILRYVRAKQQHTLSRSSVEAEYRGVANVVAETAWIHNLFRELHMSLLSATLFFVKVKHILFIKHQQYKQS
uniref:Uncharacterized protein n=1 Tax=Tanacetum cinerariifolium TaxID=118510 RepID=A0A6L2K2M7_TANCI|nr:hypothetical protein [Tanacetum cinerariifolium]